MNLIDPNELEKVLRPILTDESCPLHIAAEIDMNLDLMPKVDAVPVVRCRDCKHHDGIRCFRWNSTIITGFDDFCSNGEQMDGKGNGNETD